MPIKMIGRVTIIIAVLCILCVHGNAEVSSKKAIADNVAAPASDILPENVAGYSELDQNREKRMQPPTIALLLAVHAKNKKKGSKRIYPDNGKHLINELVHTGDICRCNGEGKNNGHAHSLERPHYADDSSSDQSDCSCENTSECVLNTSQGPKRINNKSLHRKYQELVDTLNHVLLKVQANRDFDNGQYECDKCNGPAPKPQKLSYPTSHTTPDLEACHEHSAYISRKSPKKITNHGHIYEAKRKHTAHDSSEELKPLKNVKIPDYRKNWYKYRPKPVGSVTFAPYPISSTAHNVNHGKVISVAGIHKHVYDRSEEDEEEDDDDDSRDSYQYDSDEGSSEEAHYSAKHFNTWKQTKKVKVNFSPAPLKVDLNNPNYGKLYAPKDDRNCEQLPDSASYSDEEDAYNGRPIGKYTKSWRHQNRKGSVKFIPRPLEPSKGNANYGKIISAKGNHKNINDYSSEELKASCHSKLYPKKGSHHHVGDHCSSEETPKKKLSYPQKFRVIKYPQGQRKGSVTFSPRPLNKPVIKHGESCEACHSDEHNSYAKFDAGQVYAIKGSPKKIIGHKVPDYEKKWYNSKDPKLQRKGSVTFKPKPIHIHDGVKDVDDNVHSHATNNDNHPAQFPSGHKDAAEHKLAGIDSTEENYAEPKPAHHKVSDFQKRLYEETHRHYNRKGSVKFTPAVIVTNVNNVNHGKIVASGDGDKQESDTKHFDDSKEHKLADTIKPSSSTFDSGKGSPNRNVHEHGSEEAINNAADHQKAQDNYNTNSNKANEFLYGPRKVAPLKKKANKPKYQHVQHDKSSEELKNSHEQSYPNPKSNPIPSKVIASPVMYQSVEPGSSSEEHAKKRAPMSVEKVQKLRKKGYHQKQKKTKERTHDENVLAPYNEPYRGEQQPSGVSG